MEPSTSRLQGLKVLVVEDESPMSFLLEDMLAELGCQEVVHAGSVRRALGVLNDDHPDLAILDVNLSGELVYPVAACLKDMGVPFMFATGYGLHSVSPEWMSFPVVEKPFDLDNFSAALKAAFHDREPN